MAVILRFENNKISYLRTGFPDAEIVTDNNYNDLITKLITAGANFSGAGCEDWTIEAIAWDERFLTAFTENGIDYLPSIVDPANWSVNISGRNNPSIIPNFTFSCGTGFFTFSFQSPDQLSTFFENTIADRFRNAEIQTKFVNQTDVQFRISATSDFTGQPYLTLTQFSNQTGLLNQFIEISATSITDNFDAGGILSFSISGTATSPKTITLNINENHPDESTAIPITKDTNVVSISSTNASTVYVDLSPDSSSTSNWLNQIPLNVTDLNNAINAMSDGEVRFLRPSWKWTSTASGNYAGNVQLELTNTVSENFGHFGNFNIRNGGYRTSGNGNAYEGRDSGTRYLRSDNFVMFDANQAWTYLTFYDANTGTASNRNRTPTLQTMQAVGGFNALGIYIGEDQVGFANNNTGNGARLTNFTNYLKKGYNCTIYTYDGSRFLTGVNFYVNGRQVLDVDILRSTNADIGACDANTNTLYLNTIVSPSTNQTIFATIDTNVKHQQLINRVCTTAEIIEAFRRGTFQGVVPDSDFLVSMDFDKTGTNAPANLVSITGSNALELGWATVNGVSYNQFYQ